MVCSARDAYSPSSSAGHGPEGLLAHVLRHSPAPSPAAHHATMGHEQRRGRTGAIDLKVAAPSSARRELVRHSAC